MRRFNARKASSSIEHPAISVHRREPSGLHARFSVSRHANIEISAASAYWHSAASIQPQHNYNAPASPQPSAPAASYHSQPVPARTETVPVNGSSPQTTAAHRQPTGTPRYQTQQNYYHSAPQPSAPAYTPAPAQSQQGGYQHQPGGYQQVAVSNKAATIMGTTETKTGRGIDLSRKFRFQTPRGKFPRGVFAFAAPPPLAKFPRGNFPAAIRADEGNASAASRRAQPFPPATRHSSPRHQTNHSRR